MNRKLETVKEATKLFIFLLEMVACLSLPLAGLFIGNYLIPPWLTSMGISASGGIAITLYIILALVILYLFCLLILLILD